MSTTSASSTFPISPASEISPIPETFPAAEASPTPESSSAQVLNYAAPGSVPLEPIVASELPPNEASTTGSNEGSDPTSSDEAAPAVEKKPRIGHIFIAPEHIPAELPSTIRGSVFLAGSIEMGKARNWQPELTEYLQKHKKIGPEGVAIFNPRREKWDSTWEQRKRNPVFKEQVDWELDAQARADVIAMYFDPETMSPISLLELGLFADSGKLLVCCPDGYWRKGNVEVVCDRHGVQLVETYEDFVVEVVKRLVPDADSPEDDLASKTTASPGDKPADNTTASPEGHPANGTDASPKDTPVTEGATSPDDATVHETTPLLVDETVNETGIEDMPGSYA